MSLVDEMDYEVVTDPTDGPVAPKEYEQDIYKKVTRTKDQGRFVAVRPAWEIAKMAVDIGRFNAQNKLESSSICWLDIIKFGTYLKAVAENRAKDVYVPDKWNMFETPEGLTVFGGNAQGTVARVFKASYWGSKDNYDTTCFRWKVGHFKGSKQGPGMIKPDFSSPISVDDIKVTRQEIAEISYALDLAITAHAVNNPKWYNTKRD